MSPEKMGIEAVILHEWTGNKKNGELTDLSIGDRVIVVHEQDDWVYCRRSPESTEVGYVPRPFLQKLVEAKKRNVSDSDSTDSLPPVPAHIIKGENSTGSDSNINNNSDNNNGDEVKEVSERASLDEWLHPLLN